ncbi:hypothetical protein DMENIID0001_100140 [Sergentomyia squamirostris]
MLKHDPPDFPSDVFLLLETVEVTVIIAESTTKTQAVSAAEFLKTDMKRKIVLKIRLPPMEVNRDILRTYKIMPRAQNAHAYVNAGFLFKFNESQTRLLSIRICYGGINPQFVHATATEKRLPGVDLFEGNVIQSAFQSLDQDIQPDSSLDEPTPQHRKILALGIFYKAVLKTRVIWNSAIIFDFRKLSPRATSAEGYSS